eukprot:scaffold249_cov405-Prasinococcus_capsulatus_cf.AAC.11
MPRLGDGALPLVLRRRPPRHSGTRPVMRAPAPPQRARARRSRLALRRVSYRSLGPHPDALATRRATVPARRGPASSRACQPLGRAVGDRRSPTARATRRVARVRSPLNRDPGPFLGVAPGGRGVGRWRDGTTPYPRPQPGTGVARPRPPQDSSNT